MRARIDSQKHFERKDTQRLAKLVRELHPLPLVPDLVEPLRPELRPLRRPTSEEYAASLAPVVRELPPGERPKDWANDADDANDASEISGSVDGCSNGSALESPTQSPVSPESFPHAPARAEPLLAELPPITGPQRYQVQFSTTDEHVLLIERAKALLARSTPGKSLGELHLEAMRLLVASLEEQKFATAEHSRKTGGNPTPRENSHVAAQLSPGPQPESATQPREAQRGRHIPAAVRCAVYERDGARCTYVDERGRRCQETQCLELHHRRPFGKQGAHTTANLTLHCRAHNALAAELDFGREHMEQRQQPGRHESLAAERRAARPTGAPD